jgi:predicted  nucleic acid-binding Zn-ribbon protein
MTQDEADDRIAALDRKLDKIRDEAKATRESLERQVSELTDRVVRLEGGPDAD